MAQYRYLACDVITGDVLIEVPMVQVQATRMLNSPGQFQGSMPLAGLRNPDGTPNTALQQACIDATGPKQSSIAVLRDDTCLGEWRILTRPTRKNDGSPIQVTGEWISGYFSEVVPNFSANSGDLPAAGYPGPASTPTGPGTDPLQIAWDLIDQCADPITSTTAPAGSRGLTITLPTRSALSSGQLITQTDWPGQTNTALSMLTTIQQLAPGFDWDVDVDLVGNQLVRSLTLSYPQRGSDNGVVLLQPEWGGFGGNISDYEANEDGSILATQVITVGAAGNAGSALVARSNNMGIVGAYPLMQKVISQSATTNMVQLQSQADAAAVFALRADVPPTLLILADGNPQLGGYTVGDTVTVNIGASPNFPYGKSEQLRILGIQINPPVAGAELVTLLVAVID